jgi:hypothetical protein
MDGCSDGQTANAVAVGSIQLNRHAPPAHKQAAVGAAPTATTTPVHS